MSAPNSGGTHVGHIIFKIIKYSIKTDTQNVKKNTCK